MKELLSERVRVQILGREYEMDPGGLTPLEVQSLAQFVDDRMREISEKFQIVDTQKIAVLAAINIALDYLQLKDKGTGAKTEIAPRLTKINEILETALTS